MFKAIIKLGSTLFGTPKTADAILNAGDKLFYTPEEKADDKKEFSKLNIDMIKALNLGSIASQITRRIIAFSIVVPYSLTFLIAIGFACFSKAPVENILETVKAFQMGWAFISVVGFYFIRQAITGNTKNK